MDSDVYRDSDVCRGHLSVVRTGNRWRELREVEGLKNKTESRCVRQRQVEQRRHGAGLQVHRADPQIQLEDMPVVGLRTDERGRLEDTPQRGNS